MKVSTLSLFGALTTLVGVFASDVVDLTSGNFKNEVLGEDLALVEFFAPWCGHCKNLAPHYEEAATELKSKKKIKLAKVDCTENQALCGEYGVNGYPTLKVFRNGEPTDYTGPRKADGIISYMVKQSLPAVTDVTPGSHDEFIKSDKVVLVAYGNPTIPIPDAFREYAEIARDSYLFGAYTSSPPPEIPETPGLPAIVLYKSFDEGHAVFRDSDVTVESLTEFVRANSVPLMDEISPENFGAYAEQGLPIAYLFIEPEDTTTLHTLVDALTPVAKELKGKVNFVYIDAVKFIDHGKSLNLPGDSWPAFVVQDLAAQTKYPLTGTVSAKAITEFMNKFIAGEIAPSIKSEPIPEIQEESVYHLVADDWENLFGQDDKDIFAEFFAPWCGHCQRLAPIWETLGDKYKGQNVIIAQMDATLNDVPPVAPFRVAGFPTLKFRPAGTTEFVDYNGDRSLDSLEEFVESNRRSKAPSGNTTAHDDDDDDEDEEEFEEDVPEHDEL
ncbi:thioredoxin-like protein [Naematelia encephala]|uniref:Protein disulfide-isomerase n=1 Tax=Naematelia encephala TaxID=71784 RepID=A0A1Y2AE01_9TREE|nr:thioredoxin-like protein [Naematelia encephala]